MRIGKKVVFAGLAWGAKEDNIFCLSLTRRIKIGDFPLCAAQHNAYQDIHAPEWPKLLIFFLFSVLTYHMRCLVSAFKTSPLSARKAQINAKMRV